MRSTNVVEPSGPPGDETLVMPTGDGVRRGLQLGRSPSPVERDPVLSPYLVPFLAISFILLAAAIGAIVLARKD